MKIANGTTRRFLAALVLLAIAMLGLAGPVAAEPYASTTGNIGASVTSPEPGVPFTCSVSGAPPGDPIHFVLHSEPLDLGTATADASGTASITVTIPAGYTGSHTIVATDLRTEQTWTIPLTIAGTTTVPTGTTNTGGLPNTGAAAIGIGVLALVLLASGGTLLILGRRRVGHSR